MYYNDEAGHTAYLAGSRAAAALNSECTGGLARTHDGVNSRFQLLRILAATNTHSAIRLRFGNDSPFG
jgi:hypothetical protein